jgi:hypothetical protein
MPKKRGQKSRLPPRVPGTLKLPNLELPRRIEVAKNGKTPAIFTGYVDFLNKDVRAALRSAGWQDSMPDCPEGMDNQPFEPLDGWKLASREKLREFNETGATKDTDSVFFQDGGYENSPDAFAASDREVGAAVIADHDLGMKLWRAANEYLAACAYAAKSSAFRREVSALDQVVSNFLALMRKLDALAPKPDSALALAINQTIGSRSAKDDLDQAVSKFLALRSPENDAEVSDLVDIEELTATLNVEGLTAALETFSCALKKIGKVERGRGKDANRAAHQLVAELGQIFSECTGRLPSRNKSRARSRAVTGPFGRFVNAVNQQLPVPLRDVDNLIRHEVARQRSRQRANSIKRIEFTH